MFKLKKSSATRGFACLLILFMLLAGWAIAENVAQAPEAAEAVEQAGEAPAAAAGASDYMPNQVAPAEDVAAAVQEAAKQSEDPEISIIQGLKNIAANTGFAKGEWRQYAMIAVACVLLYLAIVKQFEPLLLLPIAFGMLLANLPAAGLMSHPSFTFYDSLKDAAVAASRLGKDATDITYRFNEATGLMQYSLQTANGGLLTTCITVSSGASSRPSSSWAWAR